MLPVLWLIYLELQSPSPEEYGALTETRPAVELEFRRTPENSEGEREGSVLKEEGEARPWQNRDSPDNRWESTESGPSAEPMPKQP
jgi:hypothetical protein